MYSLKVVGALDIYSAVWLDDALACEPGLRHVKVVGALPVDVSILLLRGWRILPFARPDPEFGLYRVNSGKGR